MSSEAAEILRKLRMDLTNAQTKITAAINAIEAPAPTRCPHCGSPPARAQSLAEHIHYSHDGPEPPEWAAAEALAGLDDG